MVSAEWLPIPPVLGGAVAQLAFEAALAIREPQITVIAPRVAAFDRAEKGYEDVFFQVDIDREKAHVSQVLSGWVPPALENPEEAAFFCYLNGATDLLCELDPDVIEVVNQPAFVPYFKKQFPAKRVILYVHNEHDYRNARVQEGICKADGLIFVSRFLADRFEAFVPGCLAKAEVVYNSVDTRVWHPRLQCAGQTAKVREVYNLKPGRSLLFVGRTVFQKGSWFLLEAMDRVRLQMPDIKLLMAGAPFFKAPSDLVYLEQLKTRAAKMGDAVVFTGYIDHALMPFVYAATDVTVAPSLITEGLPMAVLESMAVGVPVIASRCGGIPEEIDDGVNGVLVDDPSDVEGLADRIVALLENRAQREVMGVAARKKVMAAFSNAVRWKHLRSFYRSIKQRPAVGRL